MKNLFKFFVLLLVSISFYQKSHAQYVVIPDANFKAFLKSRYPSCFNAADEMDTNCPSIKNVNWLLCTSMNIKDFDGLQYFTGLKEFDCGNNQATSFPQLPASITSFKCYQNKLSILPKLPAGLTFLDCSSNLLTALPEIPSSLKVLISNGNQLTVLPVLPDGLTDLYVSRNLFTSLPVLPVALKKMYCDFNQLTTLPELPVGLTDLYCQYNTLTSLPSLPSGLVNLWCMNNKLSTLPVLPNTLDVLFCDNNKITALPVLPNSLTQFICNGNLLTSLPELPSRLRVLYCHFNSITSLPALPESLMYLNCRINKLTSLPVLPSNMTVLQCSNNKLTALPELPKTVTELLCGENLITRIPVLPAGLKILNCRNNKLTDLPDLSPVLTNLDCSSNLLLYLPQLPSTLEELYCNNNRLTTLPLLPQSLSYVYANANCFTTIPVNPNPEGIYYFLVSPNNNACILPPVIQSQPLNTTVCPGAGTTFTVSATGASLSYRWQEDSGSGVFVDLISNTTFLNTTTPTLTLSSVTGLNNYKYRCKITSGTAVVYSEAALLIVTPAINNELLIRSVTCKGQATGSVRTTVSGGSLPYSYIWNTGATTEHILNQPAGTYTVTVTDANNCSVVTSALVTEPATALSTSTSSRAVVCKGDATGSATVTAVGGTAPYHFIWVTGEKQHSASSSTLTGLKALNYSVTVVDALGCFVPTVVSVAEPETAISTVTSSTPVSCKGEATGTGTVNAVGGTAPYHFVWVTGEIQHNASSSTLTGLKALNYSVTVVDVWGCFVSTVVQVSEPATVLTTSVSSTNVACKDAYSGIASVTAAGGTGPYNYTWNTGAFTPSISNLTAGNYSVAVTDANGCSSSKTVVITEPLIKLSVSLSTQAIVCKGQSTGSVGSTVSGGILPYAYEWNTGATSDRILNQPAGTYTVTVTDANGCSIPQSAVVTEPAIVLTTSVSSTNVVCKGASTGIAAVTAAGGTGPYTYAWNTGAFTPSISNLTAGNYSVDVSDANGCSSSKTVIITQPATLVGAPVVVSPVTLSLGSSATTLSAAGTSLKWYTSATGGIGVSNAPTPSTAAVGVISYYVSQTVAGCEGSRARIDVSVIEDGDIFGTSCFVLGKTYPFELNPKYKTNATHYNWWVNGSVQNITPRSAATITSISVGQYYTSGEVCVGINYSQAPWYRQFCKKVELCPNTLREAAEIESEEKIPSEFLTVFPNPSSGYFNIKAHTDIEQIRIVNMLGEVLVSFAGVSENDILHIGQDLPAGMYILQYQIKNGNNYTFSIIKQ